MAWWGKVIGGAFGFLLGGPLGALLGGALGHQFDKGMSGMVTDGWQPGNQERVQTAFFAALFSVMGHIAKADGKVSRAEVAMAEAVFDQMQLDSAQRKTAIDLFNGGKADDFPLLEVLEQFRHECHGRTTLLRMFVEVQIQAALADGALDASERAVLLTIADTLGIRRGIFEQILRMLQGEAQQQRHASEGKPTLDDAYEILGVESSTSDGELKRAYRRLMNQHHPDKLVAKGLPEEMIKLATEQTQKIRSAYEMIRNYRTT